MELKKFLENFPNIRLATNKDNAKLLEFYHQSQMVSGNKDIFYDRGKDFFAFLRLRSPEFLVFTLWQEEQLQGVAVVSYRKGYINGQLTTIGYLGDLRVSLNRKLIRQWRNCFNEFIKQSPEIKEAHHCRYYQTVLMEENQTAVNNLVRGGLKNISYQLMAPYQMINIPGLLPWFKGNEKQVSNLSQEGANLFIEDQKKRAFGHDFSNFKNHLLEFSSIINEKDFKEIKIDNEIKACAYFINPKKFKTVRLGQNSLFLRLLSQMLSILPGFKFKKLPKKMKSLDILYLSQISFKEPCDSSEKIEVLNSLLAYAFKNYEFSILAYCDFETDSLCKNLKGVYTQSIPMGFYTVHFNEENIRDEIKMGAKAPTFDMQFV